MKTQVSTVHATKATIKSVLATKKSLTRSLLKLPLTGKRFSLHLREKSRAVRTPMPIRDDKRLRDSRTMISRGALMKWKSIPCRLLVLIMKLKKCSHKVEREDLG